MLRRRSRVAADGRPLGRAGDLAVVRERLAEHPRGLFADRTRQGAFTITRTGAPPWRVPDLGLGQP